VAAADIEDVGARVVRGGGEMDVAAAGLERALRARNLPRVEFERSVERVLRLRARLPGAR
jgi:hypothetical protein